MMCLRTRFISTTLALLLASTAAWADGIKSPVPSLTDQARSRQSIEETYKDQLASNDPADSAKLVKKLIDDSYQSTNDPALRYGMLCKARDLSTSAHDLPSADIACWELSQHFKVSLAAARLQMLHDALAGTQDHDASTGIAIASLGAVDDALLVDDFGPVDQLMDIANEAMRAGDNSALAPALAFRNSELTMQKARYKKVAPQMADLAAHPGDPAANLAVGKYVCFIRGDWATGLPMLVRGSDAHLKQLAHDDLHNPRDPDIQASLGDQWYGLANLPEITGDRVRLRAYYWYQKSIEGLEGADARKVSTRIAELEPLAARRSLMPGIWAAVAKAVRAKTYQKSQTVGGGAAAADFLDVPPKGALLVGMRVGKLIFSGYPTVDYFQAIFLTPSGTQVLGKSNGTLNGDAVIFKAKPGYAIGAVIARGGAGMDALQVKFMKIKGNRLDPRESYASEKVGGDGGSEIMFDGEGTPIIGLCGRSDLRWPGFGVVYMAPVNKAQPTR